MSTRAPAPRRTGGRPIRVLLVDDHPAVRHGVRQLLGIQSDRIAVVEADAATPATSDLARWVDIAIIDYHLGDRDGLWLTQRIKQLLSPPPVLIYSAFADPLLTAAAIAAGADGLLRKTALAAELDVAIRRLLHGRAYFPAISRTLAVTLGARLEARDRAIFWMLIHGVAPEEIATRLAITRAELRERRRSITAALAPDGAGRSLTPTPVAPLDYARRRRRYPRSG